MSTEPTITRRSALRTGGLAAVMAGLMGAGTVSAAPMASELAARTVVVHVDDLAEECRHLNALYREKMDDHFDALGRFKATLTDEQFALFGRLIDSLGDSFVAEMGWQVAEIARHLPGLALAIRLVYEHTIVRTYDTPGECCTVANGFEA